MDEGSSQFNQQPGEADSQSSTVETVSVDYSEQLQIISNQQQILIGVSAMLFGALIVAAMFVVFSRFF